MRIAADTRPYAIRSILNSTVIAPLIEEGIAVDKSDLPFDVLEPRIVDILARLNGRTGQRYSQPLFGAFVRFAQSKVVLNFHPALYKALTKDTDVDSFKPPVEVWQRLPYLSAMYAMEGEVIINDEGKREPVEGVVVSIFSKVLHLCVFARSDGNVTMNELAFELTSTDDFVTCLRMPHKNQGQEYGKQVNAIALKALALALYTATENADITKRDPKEKVIKNSDGQAKFFTRSEVGANIGKKLSFEYNGQGSDAKANADGSTKITHMRRAHWRLYWLGSFKNGRGEGFQNPVMHWIPPLLVNPGDELDIVTKEVV